MSSRRSRNSRPSHLAIAAMVLLLAACAAPAQRTHKGFAPSAPAPSADDLRRADMATVKRLIGTPDLARREGEAEVWQYGGDGCSLLLFLYPEEGGTYAVTHLQARKLKSGGPADLGGCVASVAAARAETS